MMMYTDKFLIYTKLAFFLLMMTGLASIFSMNTLKNSSNFSYITLSLL